jgi:signal transduction histidine kinase
VKSNRFGYLIKIAALFAAYFITARIGLSLDAVGGFATLAWPPTGIALAAIFIFGYRLWPAVTLAAFLVNLVTGAPPLVALGMGIGNTLEALLGAYLLKRVRFMPQLERVRDVFSLVFLAAFISTALSATIGVSSLSLGGVISSPSYDETWLAWWVGDVLGNLVIASLILVWSRARWPRLRLKNLAEPAVLAVLLTGTSFFIFRGFPQAGIKSLTFAYLVFPLLIWIALRFGQRGSVTATFIVALIAVWGTKAGFGPFASDELSHGLLRLQSFIGITAITFMTMAAVVTEREKTLKHRDRLVQRATALAKQRFRLIALGRTKDEFAAIASHQLRTPATAVKQYLGLLLDGYAEPLTENQKNFLLKAYENNERQLHVIDDILQIVRLDLDKVRLDLKIHDLGAITEATVDGLQPTFRKNRQKVLIKKPQGVIRATVDKKQISTALENLLENASNYSPKGSSIQVTLKKNKGGLQITIEDKGVGIDPSDFPKLFQKFSRIPNPLSVEAGGTGLGLYWADKIIKMHKGSISIKSAVGRGSVFAINLPV